MTTFYAAFVKAMFVRTPQNATLYLEDFGLIHAAVGLADESAEVLGAIKKMVFTGKPSDVAKIIDEMGDVEFYMEALRQELGVSRDEVLSVNWEKLSLRHGDNNIEEHYKDV